MNKKIRLKFLPDSVAEKKAVEEETCDFGIVDCSAIRKPMFLISTKKNVCLDGWKVVYPGGENQLKRFSVELFKDELVQQLEEVYGEGNVVWVS
jgi:hypothetical protein